MIDYRAAVLDWAPVRDVLLCDERRGVGQALGQALKEMHSGFDITSCTDGFGLVDAFNARRADLVLIGIQTGRSAGMDALNLLLGLHPAATVLVYGTPKDVLPLAVAVTRGARGVMLWSPERPSAQPTQLMSMAASIRRTATGRNAAPLTEREIQILVRMSHGKSNSEIGLELLLSENIVKAQARRLFAKLGARDRAHAVALGLRLGLLS